MSPLLFAARTEGADLGVAPTDRAGKPLNFDFEAGSLKGWTAEGDAFAGQPIQGDVVKSRRSDMKSGHAGNFWVGTYERNGDQVQGTLTSLPFQVTQPFASFLVAGGSSPETCVQLVRKENGQVVSRVSGDDTEELKRVVVDLTPYRGQELVVRLVDKQSGGWGHLNFDDFRLHATRPVADPRRVLAAPDAFLHAGLPPAEAAAAMTVPDGFKVTLFAGEPDVHQPIGFTIDDRGRLWVAEAHSYPIRLPDDQAHDTILIFEDTNGDGKFDSKKVFADKLNLVSGIEVGFGGVWVGAAPQLLFIPDKDGDDRPDGPPQVLLDGWGYQDTHETLNSFTWGPDGWLYGCHGVFTHSRVGKPGTPDEQRVPINAGIWRYHPTKHQFEVFSQGTSNPWGIDFNEHGQAFETACVIPHLYQMIQGGRYERQAGPHFNPYTYDDIKTIADHRHYLGANPHAGNGRSGDAGGGHAHAGAMIYLGGAWPDKYRGSLFMNNIHGGRLNRDVLVPRGSGFVGQHAPDFLMANDSWSQIINLKYGPDGQVYFIDWYDRQQCHDHNIHIHDRTNGRIYKVSYQGSSHSPVNLDKATDASLVKLQTHANDFFARHARRILQERGAKPEVREGLHALIDQDKDPIHRLRGLWTLQAAGGLNEAEIKTFLGDRDPYLRAWTVQFASETPPSQSVLGWLAERAKTDASPVVRLYLASALQRIPGADRWEILGALTQWSEDAGDHNLPLMEWYAAEPLAVADPARALRLATEAKIPTLLPFMARRIGAIGTPEAIALLVETLERVDRPELQLAFLQGLNDALKGRRQVGRPAAWPAAFAKLAKATDPAVRSLSTSLGVTFGDVSALEAMRKTLADPRAEVALRQNALTALVKIKDAGAVPTLQVLVADPAFRSPALRALAAFDDPKTPEVVLSGYAKFTPTEKRDALNTLAARVDFARPLLAAVGKGTVSSADLSADLIRQLRNHKDKDVDAQIAKHWGAVRETTEDKAKLIATTKAKLAARPRQAPDPALGRAVFAKTCQQCHTLFGVGGKVGPELTGSNRSDLDYLLSNVLDPSALIGKDYLAHVIATADGRVLTGILRDEDKDALTIVTANETVTVPKAEVEDRRPSEKSMMPDDLFTPLSDHEVRSLVAYLASAAQVPMLATAENVTSFFNGRDLTGWQGEPTLWTVENGEIVGKTAGLKQNTFLRSDLLCSDFKLTLQVKLVANQGNSGIQFRSQAAPHDEVKGYQADIGPDWWGKVYEELGRGLLWKESGERYVKMGEWNTYEIVAVGSKIKTAINGKACADLDDPTGARRGIFAFQLHSGGPTEVRYKDLRLELIPAGQAAVPNPVSTSSAGSRSLDPAPAVVD
ncbi:PVC-type heme-binding CxxCH protein [Singulisphaera sp. GP187]|uniref:PVC-type heme-binding CxxCH protein n=1 Tax=Singulisphaera sp. GP187 TaxID=1882752 RepID=UPI0020B11379|nr:PVC-type heme-binding CxxCH protein [Singulisphaera sp. GP187]